MVSARLVGLLCIGLTACPAPDPDPVDTGDPEPQVCSLPEVGAPIPLRRLTATQLEHVVADSLVFAIDYDVSDENLIGFDANTHSDMDSTTARTFLFAAEQVATQRAPSAMAFEPCATGPDDGACADWLLDTIGTPLFRRPLSADDRAPFHAVFDAGVAEGGRAEGVRWLLEAMLQSPRFLYQVEFADEDGWLDGYSVASRLAFSLWGSGPFQVVLPGSEPDVDLLALAEAGQFDTPEGIAEAVEWMMADPRFDRGMNDFTRQWMKLDTLGDADERPDLLRLPLPSRQALAREPSRFAAHQFRTDGTTLDLLTSNITPEEPDLAILYGDDALGSAGGLTELDPAQRGGLLTLPGVQAALSHAGVTSPSRRGAVVMANIICRPPSPPPDDVIPNLPPETEGKTTRERLELHFSDERCASCHETMDGIGFTYEGYGPYGESRELDNGFPVDTTGSFGLFGQQVEVEDAVELGAVLGDHPLIAECLARQWTRFTLSISDREDAECLVEDLGTLAHDASLKEMMVALATSDWFRRAAPEVSQ